MDLQYLGGSGFRIGGLSRPLYIDPPPGTPFESGLVALLSHGHADHIDGVRRWLKAGHRPLVGASATLLAHLGLLGLALTPGQEARCAGIRLRVFSWTHRPRLHWRPLAGLGHLLRLGRRPRALQRAIQDGLTVSVGPELGFVIELRDGTRIAAVGEGLHEGADAEALARAIGRVDHALVGVEAEDLPALPELLRPLEADRISIFDPHRHLRLKEGRPVADLEGALPRLGSEVQLLVA